jgi:phenylacetate-CoA ligase
LLREIQGRTTDFVVAADGTVMHGLALIYILRDQPGVEAFKIIQESLERTRVLVVPNKAFDETTRTAIQTGLARRLGDRVDIVVELVEEIVPEKSGKFRYVVSHVAA